MGKCELSLNAGGCANRTTNQKRAVSTKAENAHTQQSGICIPTSIYPIQGTRGHSRKCIIALLLIGKKWKETIRQTVKYWHIHTMENYTAMKRNELLPYIIAAKKRS